MVQLSADRTPRQRHASGIWQSAPADLAAEGGAGSAQPDAHGAAARCFGAGTARLACMRPHQPASASLSCCHRRPAWMWGLATGCESARERSAPGATDADSMEGISLPFIVPCRWLAAILPKKASDRLHQLLQRFKDELAVLQARVSAFRISAANGTVVNNKSMTQWLETSFWGLPTDRHRQMFLDAATVLQAQPLEDLRCAWTAMVQLDDHCADEPAAAACIVDACLAELVASSLVSVVDSGFEQQWPETVRRCVTTLSAFLQTPARPGASLPVASIRLQRPDGHLHAKTAHMPQPPSNCNEELNVCT